MTTTATTIQKVEVEGLTLAYREAGDGPAVLLLHGWPTSSFLWREIMPPIAPANRVVALDMPGFGASDKPLGIRYDFAFFGRVLDGFLAALEIDRVALGVHDLGGPVGLHWALHRPERVTAVAFLNTLVYPELSEAVLEFVRVLSTPELSESLTSPAGLEEVMKLGLDDEANLTPEVLAGLQEPFTTEDSRRALAAAGIGLELEGFPEIARRLPDLRVPVRIVYGERDRVLPDVGDTMARIVRDVPQAEVTSLPCGHFLQEEAPGEVGDLLAAFFARATGGQQP